ncbi:MAG: histone deacetylase family protein [Gemmataceae bacterium]
MTKHNARSTNIMRLWYTDHYVLPLPAAHTFPMEKYRRLRESILATGLTTAADWHSPASVSLEQLHRAHHPDYVEAMTTGRISAEAMKLVGFPWSEFLVERSRRSSGATLEAARAALTDGIAANLAGGTHHAFADHGEGYCLFNDSVICARTLQHEGRVQKVLILDLDVHQGNGTAAIVQDDPHIFALSVHGAKNYPWRKVPGDLDVELPDRTGDAEYLAAVEEAIGTALSQFHPDLVIYLAGADPYEHDRLGRLALTRPGLAERDRLVFETFQRLGVPIVVTMAGGYAKDVADTVAIHTATITRAIALY